jgi:hypothetical protein
LTVLTRNRLFGDSVHLHRLPTNPCPDAQEWGWVGQEGMMKQPFTHMNIKRTKCKEAISFGLVQVAKPPLTEMAAGGDAR